MSGPTNIMRENRGLYRLAREADGLTRRQLWQTNTNDETIARLEQAGAIANGDGRFRITEPGRTLVRTRIERGEGYTV